MNRSADILAVLLLLISAAQGLCQSAIAPDSRKVLEDYRTVRSLFPRPEGSEGERQLLAFIEERLKELRISYSWLDFRESDGNHSFSSNIVAEIEGELSDTLLVGVPVNHPPEISPELDGSINVVLALNLLEHLSRRRLPLSVKVLFLGAEYGEQPEYPMSSRLFLRDFYPDYRVMTLYLNLKRIPSRLHLRTGGRGTESPYWLLDHATEALQATDIFFLMRGNENQIFRIGLTSERTIIEPFLFAGYPAISFEGEYENLTALEEEKWVDSFSLSLMEFLQSFAGGIPETWDRHYLFFQARGFYFSISEKVYIIILLIVLAVILAYGLLFTRRLRKYLRTLGHHLWALPLFFLSVFLLLFLATWVLEGILRIRNMIELWQEMPLLFLIFKLAVPLALLFVLLNLVRRLPIPRRGSFYSAAALLFLLLDIVVLAVINISFTYYFLWAFTFALVFSVTPHRPLKVLLFLASPYWLVKTVVELFTLPRLEFCRVLLLSKITGNLLLTVILIPFILMFIRLKFIFPPARITTNRIRLAVTASLFAAVLFGLLITFFVYSPYGGEKKQPVTASYVLDEAAGTGYLELSSPAPLANLQVHSQSSSTTINTRSRLYTLPLAETWSLLDTQISSVSFLDRKNINLRFTPWDKPYRIRLTVSAEEEFTLFDANFPSNREPGGRQYTILIGANPPLPLDVQLTVPRARTFTVAVTLEYLRPPEGYELYGENIALSNRLTYKKELRLRT